jgi:hypothetical protein
MTDVERRRQRPRLARSSDPLTHTHEGDDMRFRTRALVATIAITAVPVGHVAAQPPTRTPPAGDSVAHLAADQTPCGAFTLKVHDGERYTMFYDRNGDATVLMITGALRMTVTSDITGRSIDLNIPGPAKVLADGTIIGGGPWLLWSPTVFAYATGRIVIPQGNVDNVQIDGHRTDLCAILVG